MISGFSIRQEVVPAPLNIVAKSLTAFSFLDIILAIVTMWYVYIIKSEIDGTYYTGSAQNVPLRVERHNAGWTKSTKGKRPWKLVYTETYQSKSQAVKREYEIKRWKSRKMIEDLINRSTGDKNED